MDRRNVLTRRRVAKNDRVKLTSPSRTLSGLNPYAGPWTTNEIIHLLKRTCFGAKKNDVDYFATRTMNQAVDELLNPASPNPAPPVKEYVTTTQGGSTPMQILYRVQHGSMISIVTVQFRANAGHPIKNGGQV
jgi:hypothetical protein